MAERVVSHVCSRATVLLTVSGGGPAFAAAAPVSNASPNTLVSNVTATVSPQVDPAPFKEALAKAEAALAAAVGEDRAAADQELRDMRSSPAPRLPRESFF